MRNIWRYQRADLIRSTVRWQDTARRAHLAAAIEVALGNLDSAIRFQLAARQAGAMVQQALSPGKPRAASADGD